MCVLGQAERLRSLLDGPAFVPLELASLPLIKELSDTSNETGCGLPRSVHQQFFNSAVMRPTTSLSVLDVASDFLKLLLILRRSENDPV